MTEQTKQNRIYPLRMPPNWEPPYPSFESQFDEAVSEIAMAVLGAQYLAGREEDARGFIFGLAALVGNEGMADHVDISHCAADGAGRMQYVVTAYWLNPARLSDFFEDDRFKAYWARGSADVGFGIFREIFNIPLNRFETLHSGPDHLVGVANTRTGLSDPIQTHAYWGSMRDRVPDSAQDRFDPDGDIAIIEQSPGRVVVQPSRNLAVIRSGQDLTNAVGVEREEYYDDVEPVLKAGMNFLRDQGLAEVGCHDCRYMTLLESDGKLGSHTYGLAYFRSLADLEGWAEHHDTHLAIFNAFLQFAPKYGPAMKSRYWHEVSVLPAQGQFAEYINCGPGTGLMPGG